MMFIQLMSIKSHVSKVSKKKGEEEKKRDAEEGEKAYLRYESRTEVRGTSSYKRERFFTNFSPDFWEVCFLGTGDREPDK
jgi:hypothetical protein